MCMWLATIAAAVNAALLLGSGTLPIDERVAYLMERAAECLWPLSVLVAMLFYARHVIYVTNEPAPQPQGEAAAANTIELNWFERWRERRREAAERRRVVAEQQRAERADAARQAKAEAETLRAEKAAKKAAAKAEAAALSASEEETKADPVPPVRKSAQGAVPAAPLRSDAKAVTPGPKAVVSSRPAAPAAEAEAETEEDDEAEDDSDTSLQGLSRKERRRLRKLQRQNAGRI